MTKKGDTAAKTPATRNAAAKAPSRKGAPHKRHDGRKPDQTRPVSFKRNFTKHAGGSVLVSFGETRVLCTAMIEKDLPPWLRAKGPGAGGWLTAEYSMLPSSTTTRKRRDSGKPDGRSVEIQRLVGRALRACINL